MKTVIYFATFFIFLLTACGKTPGIEDTISEIKLSSDTIDADGSSVDTLTVILNNKNASADRRGVIFTASGGTLLGGTDGKLTLAADYLNQQLTAKAVLIAPLSAGDITVTATPATSSSSGTYMRSKIIIVNKVFPATIHLESSSAGIGANFINSDTIIGTIHGPMGKKVSSGVKVVFDDNFLNGDSARGVFRYQKISSDKNGQVMAYYSGPATSIGTVIVITVTVLKDTGEKSDITDKFKLTVNQ